MTDATNGARAAGMAKMDEVYGFSVDPDTVPGPYVDVTVDHLFGAVWTREALGLRDRRMLTIGVLAALGLSNLSEIQFRAALERDELTEEQVREVVLHLTHYIGWPLSTGLNTAAERSSPPGPPRPPPTGRRSPEMTDATPSTPTTTFDFHGRVAIVTGSAGGIGRAYAEALAGAGASVVVADIDAAGAEAVAEGIRSSGGPRSAWPWTWPIPHRPRPWPGPPWTPSADSTTWSTTPRSSGG